jgi:hypothetical protein
MPPVRCVLLLATVLAAGCGGGGGQDRPVLVGSFPAAGETVPPGLASIRLDFDDKVRLFRPDAVTVLHDGLFQGVFLSQLPGETHNLRLTPLPGQAFGPGDYVIEVRGGFVVNLEDHYALETAHVTFTVGGTGSVFLGSPTTNSVRELDGETLALVETTPTPGGRDPVGIAAVRYGQVTRVFVQLASGGGTGRSLAWFTPGAGTMTEVVLTPSPGSDLVATAPAILLAPDGISVFAAFRDVLTQRVRLHRVRVIDGVETGVITLSPAAGPATAPAGLAVRADLLTLLVPCQEGATGRVAYVDVPAFAEVDRDLGTVGVQPASLGGPAGPADVLNDHLGVAPAGATTAAMTFLELGTDVLIPDPSAQVGVPTSVHVTFDGAFLLEGLSGPGAAPNLLAVRPGADGTTDAPFPVSDLVGAAPQGASAVRAIAPVPGRRALHVLLDANVLVRLSWDGAGLVQDDLDGVTAGLQGAGLAATAPGSTCVTGVTVYPP